MEEVPEELRRFFAERCGGSVEQLRIALLFRSEPDRIWSVEAVADALRMPASSTGMRLFLLGASGVVAGSGSPVAYRYAPAAATDAMLALIERLYMGSPEAMKRLKHDASPDPLESFAGAFDLRSRNG